MEVAAVLATLFAGTGMLIIGTIITLHLMGYQVSLTSTFSVTPKNESVNLDVDDI